MAGLLPNKKASFSKRGKDFYASPFEAVPPLLHMEHKRIPHKIVEPCCGNGALVLPFRNRGFSVRASDLGDWGCPDSDAGIDFFSDLVTVGNDEAIVTNPPFKLIEPFIERATRLADYCAIFARFSFLESQGRYGWFKRMGLQRVHLIVDRLPMMHRFGYEGPKLDEGNICYAWFIFDQTKRPKNFAPVYPVMWRKAIRYYPQFSDDVPPKAKDNYPLLRGL